jgi:hypothetical protein
LQVLAFWDDEALLVAREGQRTARPLAVFWTMKVRSTVCVSTTSPRSVWTADLA